MTSGVVEVVARGSGAGLNVVLTSNSEIPAYIKFHCGGGIFPGWLKEDEQFPSIASPKRLLYCFILLQGNSFVLLLASREACKRLEATFWLLLTVPAFSKRWWAP
jgi:hypothetical protein